MWIGSKQICVTDTRTCVRYDGSIMECYASVCTCVCMLNFGMSLFLFVSFFCGWVGIYYLLIAEYVGIVV